jgi:4-amino-4-deoxy-L-arabinose transferase-like glycosyltransferase
MLKNLANWLTVPRYSVVILILLVIAVFSALPILDLRLEEPRRALVALEMFITDNYAVPTLHGEPYYNKPPVFNWMILLFIRLFGGFDEWIVRLPSVLGYFGMGIITFMVVRKYVNKELALISSLMVLTIGDFLFYTTIHSGEIDLFYSFVTLAQVITLFVYYDRRQLLLMFWLSYFLMTVGILTKGIPSIAFQGITLIALSVYYKDFKLLFRWQHFTGLFMGIVLLWGYFSWYSQYNDPLPFITRLFTESSDKSVVENTNFWEITISLLKFPVILASKLMPWALLILVIIFSRKGIKNTPKNPLIQYLVLFTLTNLLIYWLTPDVRFRYVLMFYPPLIIILAYYCHTPMKWLGDKKWFYYAIFAFHLLVITALITSLFLPLTHHLTALNRTIPILILPALFNLYYHRQYPKRYLLTFIFSLVILRFVMNLTYLPLSREADFNYKDFMEKSVEITRNDTIYFVGGRRHYSSSLPFSDKKVNYSMPGYINYKLPYYICREKKTIMPFHEKPAEGKFYITTKNYLDELGVKANVFITSTGHKEPYVLFKLAN